MTRVLGPVLVAGLLLASAACGSGGEKVATTDPPTTSPSHTSCLTRVEATVPVDLSGEGPVQVDVSAGQEPCPGSVAPRLPGEVRLSAPIDDVPVARRPLYAVTVPGRTGELVLLVQRHPRGGFQASVFGYADGAFAELTVAGDHLVPFTATDAPTRHVAARCTPTGFDLVEAVPHAPVGAAPAWDVYRTPFTVAGNELRAGARATIAGNVRDGALGPRFPDVVRGDLFRGCRS